MRFILLICICWVSFISPTFSQIEYLDVKSSILKQSRQIKLQLPRNYASSKKKYPVIIVLDGDYLFEPFAGNIDYLSYWEIIPEAIVVGINQVGYRINDGKLNSEDELPDTTGADFFEFIGFDVLQAIEENYRTAAFNVIAGIDYMANFSNFYLLKDYPIFNGYINLSPDLTPKMPERLELKLKKIDQKTWYYLSTSKNDVKKLRDQTLSLNSKLKSIRNPNLNYTFEDFDQADHYSFVPNAIPKSLLSIFSGYRPISDDEYKSKLLKAKFPSNVLEDKYLDMEELYAIKIPIRIRDFLMTERALIENEIWEDYRNLGRLAKKQAPETVLYNYFMGRYFEKTGQPKRAIKEYQSAYGLKNANQLTSDDLLNLADELSRTFGN